MKFVLPTQELNYLLNKIQNVVSQKPTIPILANFMIEARNNIITLTATDLVVGIKCDTDATIIEEGATTLPVKKFVQLARELTTMNVEISSNAKEVTTIVAGTSRFKINGMNQHEFPTLPDMSKGVSFKIKQSDLKDMLFRTSFAVSKEDNRYVLTGVNINVSNGKAVFIGTDGKRLARAQCPVQLDPSINAHAIVPLKAVDEVLKNLRDDEDALITIFEDKIDFQANNTRIISKIITGDYPDVERVIPTESSIVVTLHREELISLLRQISLFSPENNLSVRFTLSDGELRLSANSIEVGEGDVSMPVNYHGPKLEIAFNPGFFIDILRHSKHEVVTLGLTDSYNPGLLTDGETLTDPLQLSPLFIIMPLRLSE